MATRLEELETRKRKLEQRLKQINEKEKILRAKQKNEQRKARDHATYVLGGLLLRALGGDWEVIDWDKVATLFSDSDVRKELRDEGMASAQKLDSYKESLARLKKWERGE